MTGRERHDAIVIGAGAMGSATAYRLARAGRRVLILERHAAGHDLGSSHGPGRIIRYTYEHEAYVRLMRDAYAAWDEVEREANEVLFHRTGDLFFGPAEGPLATYAESLTRVGVPFDRLTAAEAQSRFPAFRLPSGFMALHQRESGVLHASLCVATHLRLALARGAVLREGETVRAIGAGDPSAPLVRVETDRAAYEAERVVVAGGAWMAKLLPDLRLPLRVTRQRVAYFRPRGDAAPYRPDRFPVFVHVGAGATAADILYYGLPIFGRFGVKVARHRTHAPAEDPDTSERAVLPGELADVRAFLADHIPGLADAAIVEPHVCLYTMTPDEHFAVDLHPADPRVVVVSACSGHGFKFSSVIGRIAAELALAGRSSVEAFEASRGFFGIARFAAPPKPL
jgi:sarcosine oxidase